MRLLPTAVTSALTGLAVASLALSLTSAPVSAALYREPLTKDTVAYVPTTVKNPGTDDFRRIKLDITPLKGETVKRYGHEVAAVYDVKVVYKKHVLLHRHLGYWRTLAATTAAQRKEVVKSDAFVKAVRAASDLTPAKAKALAQKTINRELHTTLISDVRNTVGYVYVAIAQQNENAPSTGSDYSFDLQPILDHASDYTTFSSTADYSYGKQARIEIVKIPSKIENVDAFAVIGHLAGDGFTITFNSNEGTFTGNYQK